MRSMRERMLAGEDYRAADPELQAEAAACKAWLARYNAGAATLAERLAEVGEGAVIRAPFHCDYGFNIRLGAGTFLNFNCVVLDVAEVTIGDCAQIGPGVQLLAADHPRDAARRREGWESGKPIHIGADVWIGGGALILPGVTVGQGAIVGAGAVVTRDVPPGATVVGNPARLLP
ncbi:sugar O-acetyltransferase [Roseococcus sp. YIM B11640]|uniref:sugar O-acetyltransferase n=1 Tax=Roseococcus sp. YIM B11640 TaxID=3133973 RepID=UPI003C7DB851